MQEQSNSLLSDPGLVAARDNWFTRLESLFGGEAPGSPFYLNGVYGRGRVNHFDHPALWIEQAIDSLAEHADKLHDTRVFRPLVVEYGCYGVHFVDRILGADVYDLDGTYNWQVRCLTTPVGELHKPDLERDETWRLARTAAEAFVQAGANVPLFGLPTIASALNIGLNLYGGELLVAMHEKPHAVRHDLGVINDLLCELHRWYIDRIPARQLQPVVGGHRTQPPGFGQICGCSTQLLSPELYRDFIAPLDAQLLSVYPNGGMIHLCGGHTQHIRVWREMKALRSIQLNDRAAGDLKKYFHELREDQVFYVNPCPEMPLEHAVEITGGRRTVFVTEPPKG